MEEELKYRYWIKSVPGIGNKKQKKLVEYCGSAKEVYRLTEKQLLSVQGIGKRDAAQIIDSKKNWILEKEAELLTKKGIRMVSMAALTPFFTREISRNQKRLGPS